MLIKRRKEKVDIICVQETHIKKKDHKLLEHSKLGDLFYTADEKKKKKEIALYIDQWIEA